MAESGFLCFDILIIYSSVNDIVTDTTALEENRIHLLFSTFAWK